MVADLSLASTYVPSFMAVAKCICVALVSTVILPLGGAPVIGLALLVDREMMNDQSILDVNALVCALGAAMVANYSRATAFPTQLSIAIAALWTLVSVGQSLRAAISPNAELMVAAVLAACLSFTQFPGQPLAFLVLRVIAYNLAVLVPSYLEAPQSIALVCLRTAPLLVAPAPVAAVFFVCQVAVWVWKHRGSPSSMPSEDVEASLVRAAIAQHKANHAH